MRLARNLINLPIISIAEGREIGKVKDLYLDSALMDVTAIYLGSEGLINRSESFIRKADVVTMGRDAILVQDAGCIFDEAKTPEYGEWLKKWVRRDGLQEREMITPGGTKIGRVGDLILDEDARITGFSLSQVLVSGPVAENKAVTRSAMVAPANGSNGAAITIDLEKAEQADLRIEYQSLFSEPTIALAGESEATTSDA